MRRKCVVGAVLATVLVVGLASPALAFDKPAEPDTQYILDNIFVFIAAVLVLFMQAGFALVEAGLTRAKNVANIMMKNMMDLAAGVLAFAAIGFSIAYGPDGNDFFGLGGWFLNPAGFDESSLTLATNFLFQVAFAATAATIVSGAMAERTKFKSYFIYSFAITAFIYPVVVRWMWGGGWLSKLDIPFGDFAGSTVVHSVGGWAALMGAIILGPRLGKYGADGKPRAIPGHSMPLAVLGVLILFIGWFGFNPGSELAADLAVGDIAVTTLIAAAAGAVASTIAIWLKSGYPDVGMAGNGMLAGLVSITAGCGALDNWGALAAGLIGGVIVVFAVALFERSGIDDPVGAISVHGVCGAWGTLAVGLFATKADGFVATEDAGLFYGGGLGQLGTQAIGVLAVFVFVVVASGLLFLAIRATVGLRVSEDEEIEGLDIQEHGAPGYGLDALPSMTSRAPAGRMTTAKAEV
ncbi:MAG TPA: ammonium transporter [Acidimicrobiales bacterium]|jgi:ammonium transporter, Amt family|nr:ammonium transporter [Acidimicrobiales bacterium]